MSDMNRTNPQSLARLLAADAAPQWTADDLAAMWRHQLRASAGAGLTFGELFANPHPPLEILEQAKALGKSMRRECSGFVPAEMATVIYYASIVAAKSRCGHSISDLDDEALRRGIQWALAQPWLDATTRSLFQAWTG